MVTHLTDTPVPVVHLHQAPRRAMPAVRARWLFAFWMAAGAVIAIAAGLVLGILAALQASIGGDRWTPTVQAHGRLQLFGFLASFIVAVALEFLPRLNSRPMFPARVRVALPALLATGAVLLAAGQAFEDTVGWLVVPGGLVFAAGAIGFFVTATRVKSTRPLRVDPQPLYLKAAAAWLAIAALLSLWAMAKSEAGVIPLEYSRSVVEVFLRGFVLLVIMGVGLRAFVGHLALEPLTPRRQIIVWAVLNVSVAAWLTGQGLGPLPKAEWLWRMADVGFVTGIVMFTVWLGILGPLRATRGAPRYAVLVPLAWLGVLVYSVFLFASATVPALHNLDLYEEGGIRHVYMLGFVVPLMVAMGHIVLARFGTGRVEWENALTAAFVVLCVAWPLRVIPALLDQASSDVGKWLLATAGVLVMVALSLVAAVCLRTAFLMARAGSA